MTSVDTNTGLVVAPGFGFGARLAAVEELVATWDLEAAQAAARALLDEPGLPPGDRLTARRLLAETLRELGDLDAAYDLAEAVSTQAEQAYGPADVATVHAWAVLAAVRHDYDEWDAAEALYHRVLDSGVDETDPVTGPEAARVIRLTRVNLALLQRDRGQRPLALAMLNAAYVVHRREYGADDLDTIRIAAELAALHHADGNVPASRRLFTVAHAAARSRLGNRHPFTKAVEWELAAVEPPMPASLIHPVSPAPQAPPEPASAASPGPASAASSERASVASPGPASASRGSASAASPERSSTVSLGPGRSRKLAPSPELAPSSEPAASPRSTPVSPGRTAVSPGSSSTGSLAPARSRGLAPTPEMPPSPRPAPSTEPAVAASPRRAPAVSPRPEERSGGAPPAPPAPSDSTLPDLEAPCNPVAPFDPGDAFDPDDSFDLDAPFDLADPFDVADPFGPDEVDGPDAGFSRSGSGGTPAGTVPVGRPAQVVGAGSVVQGSSGPAAGGPPQVGDARVVGERRVVVPLKAVAGVVVGALVVAAVSVLWPSGDGPDGSPSRAGSNGVATAGRSGAAGSGADGNTGGRGDGNAGGDGSLGNAGSNNGTGNVGQAGGTAGGAAGEQTRVQNLRLQDDGTALAVTWTPLGSTAVVALSRAGGPAVVVAEVPAGTASYVVKGVDPVAAYCVVVGPVDAAVAVTAGTSVCTGRR